MLRLGILVSTLLLPAGTISPGLQEESREFLLELAFSRPGLPADASTEERQALEGHLAYWRGLHDAGRVVLAGAQESGGVIVFRAADEADAGRIVQADPAAAAGLLRGAPRPFQVDLLEGRGLPGRFVEESDSRAVRAEVVVPAGLAEVWRAWTTDAGVRSFFARGSRVELRVGGPYELFFMPDAPPGSRGSEGCRVLAWLPGEMLAFDWNSPPAFATARRRRTQVIVLLQALDGMQTRVRLIQHGFGRGEEWDQVFDYFRDAWPYVLNNLKKRFESGPLWTEEENP